MISGAVTELIFPANPKIYPEKIVSIFTSLGK
jgi:hypothetical protein